MTYSLKKIVLCFALLFFSSLSFANCTASEIKSLRADALKQSKSKNIKGAEAILSTYYENQCSYYDMTQEADSILNQGLWLISDLMYYRKKLQNYLGCLSLSDDVYAQWKVSNPSRHTPKGEKALQTNKAQCEAALNTLYQVPEKCPIAGYENMFAVPNTWRKGNELFFEVACLTFVENTKNKIGSDRDGPQRRSEGMNSIPKLQVLYVENVSRDGDDYDENGEYKWKNNYQLDTLYFTDLDNKLWETGYCYNVKLGFGKKAGELLLNGSSSACIGGSGTYINRVIAKLNFPLSAQVIKSYRHTYK